MGSVSLALVIATALGVFILKSTRGGQITVNEQAAQHLDEELAKDATLSQTAQQYSALQSVVTHMNKVLDNRFSFLPVWNAVKESVPRDVQFVSVNMSDDRTFRVSGVTRSVSSVANFAAALEKRSEVTVVTPLSVDKQSTGGLFNFSISFKAVKKKTSSQAAR